MKIKHCHFKTIDSTQDFIRQKITDEFSNQLSKGPESSFDLENEVYLVSTNEQTKGRGRRGTSWIQTRSSLAFSFLLPVREVIKENEVPLTIAPLAIGQALLKSLNELSLDSLYLKWPNDIVNSKGQKVAGILCEGALSQSFVLVGIGINIQMPGQSSNEALSFADHQTALEGAFLNLDSQSFKKLKEEYSSRQDGQQGQQEDQEQEFLAYCVTSKILSHHKAYFDLKFLQDQFLKKGYLVNEQVLIVDLEDGAYKKVLGEGYILGIGDYGQLLLKNNQEIQAYTSGSVRKKMP